MDDVVERVMASCKNHERQGREDIRVRWVNISRSLHLRGSVTSKNLLTGLAYLRILHQGPDPRYSNC